MLIPLMQGSLLVICNMIIQIVVMLLVIRMLLKRMGGDPSSVGFLEAFWVLAIVIFMLFVGHVMQFATWAVLFVYLGEFDRFSTAFYHSGVNFTSLGYGDIVMSERWRLLGPIEAANGVLMFGLSAGAILSIMNRIFGQFIPGLARNTNGVHR